MENYDVLVVGAGPIGLACGIEAKKRGLSAVLVEKGCLANSIYNYPANMRFFSTSNLLEIGELPFVTTNEKPVRAEALEYYRRVAQSWQLNIKLYEKVLKTEGASGAFEVQTTNSIYKCRYIILAIGFFDIPRMLDVPGEELDKVTHYFREPHPYADQDLLIVGSGNSAAIAALECFRHGARVSVAVRGENFHDSIKYWIRPDIDNRIADGEITAYFNSVIKEIHPSHVLLESKENGVIKIENDFVLALTGYQPDFGFLKEMGVRIGSDSLLTPVHNTDTCETNREGIYLAGVVVGGMQTNKWFIENSRIHATQIFDHIQRQS